MKKGEWVLLPGIARVQFRKLLEKQQLLLKKSEGLHTESKKGSGTGVVCAGNAFNYFMEVSDGKTPFIKISSYPLPIARLNEFISKLGKVVVLEEGHAFIEERIRALPAMCGKELVGKLSEQIPLDGELNPEKAMCVLGIKAQKHVSANESVIAQRPPQPCAGCPHSDLYRALNEAKGAFKNAMVFGDIGCYTLGALKPFLAIGTCIEMGSSVNLARGASVAGAGKAIGIIGDSTFVHGGMPALLEAAKKHSPITLIILDNATVAMTGGQETLAQGKEIERICEGLGIEKGHIREIIPLPNNHAKNVEIMKEEFSYNGPSVIISRRACIQVLKNRVTK
jgi:indolepyruvate ferredoxin oxidoreductase alpha subunit